MCVLQINCGYLFWNIMNLYKSIYTTRIDKPKKLQSKDKTTCAQDHTQKDSSREFSAQPRTHYRAWDWHECVSRSVSDACERVCAHTLASSLFTSFLRFSCGSFWPRDRDKNFWFKAQRIQERIFGSNLRKSFVKSQRVNCFLLQFYLVNYRVN